MGYITKTVFFSLFALGLLMAGTSPALATAPYLSLADTGSGNVNLMVSNAAINSSIQLSYTQSGSTLATTINNFGATNGSGYYSTSFNGSAYGISSGSQVYVTVAGQQSNIVQYNSGSSCGYYGCGSFTLSQTNVNLNAGQSAAVYGNGVSSIAVNSNSNPAAVSYSINGSQLNLYGQSNGSSTLSVCTTYYPSQCINLYVTVGGGTVGGLTFNPSSLSLASGQSSTVSISSGVNMSAYPPYVSSNSNSNAVSASVSNNQLYVTGMNTGSSTITVCLSGGSTCGSINVTVSGSYYPVSFSQNNITLNAGQSQSVNIYGTGSSGSYYISSNSNSNAVSASISGTSVYLTANNAGSANISVCQSANSSCGILYVTVSGGSGSLSLSQTNVNLSAGQSATVYAYGQPNIYISNNTNSGVVTASVSGSQISLYGNNAGSSTVTVCANSASQCGYIYVTVGGGTVGGLTFNPSSLSLASGQSSTVSISSGVNMSAYPPYVSSNSNSNAVSASVSNNQLYVTGMNTGSSTITVCLSGGSTCGSINVTVNGYNNGNLSFTTTNLPQPAVGQYYSQQLQVTGGTAPYTFTIISGAIPAGMSLTSGGQLIGSPLNTAAAYFTVRATDIYGRSQTANFTLVPVGGSSGGNAYSNGMLINENGTVYIVYKNTKTGFASAYAFLGFGFSFNNVVAAGNTGLANSGYIVRTSQAAHPWGSWIKSGNTIYFVHEAGLIPISDYNIFLNNGGKDNLVVPANSYDFALPMLPIMTMNDYRLNTALR
ncbi:MAG: hypothetical protein M1383_02475 [Patescibacteria group bacterium]|nr:hypothetical protein [Patescibacteria group bacterium]